MVVEYKKDLRHNYMIIIEEEMFKLEPYCVKMLEQQQIEGILPLEQRLLDNRILFYYDITARQSMLNLLEKVVLSYDKVSKLVFGILTTIERAYEYLLPEDDFILSPEFIYMDLATYTPSFCYLSGYHKNLNEQMNSLLEYLMNKVDYNDKEAVFLVYQLYAVSKEDGFTFEHLLGVLQTPNHNGTGNMKRINTEEQGPNDTWKKGISHVNEKNYSDMQATENNKYKLKIDSQSNNLSGKKANPKTFNYQSEKSVHKDKLYNNRIKLTSSEENQREKQKRIPVMMEKLEDEAEQFYYPMETYLLSGVCIFGGLGIIVLSFTTNLIYNSFGNRVDYSKLAGLLLILLCLEGYLLKLIWDKKNKLSRLIKRKEYIDPRHEETDINSNPRKNVVLFDEKKASPIWQGQEVENLNRIEAITALEPYKVYETYRKVDPVSEEDEEDNPTCLLNEADKNKRIILKPLDETRYQEIIITEYPFFVGKLKNNVDYCLEKDVVSRFHAKITKEMEQYYITDLNSTNGTFVNREVVETYQRKEIKFGDEIAFANIKYWFIQE